MCLSPSFGSRGNKGPKKPSNSVKVQRPGEDPHCFLQAPFILIISLGICLMVFIMTAPKSGGTIGSFQCSGFLQSRELSLCAAFGCGRIVHSGW